MKKTVSLIAILLCLSLGLAGCKKEAYAIKVDGWTVTENDYARQANLLRTTYLANTGDEDTEEFWTEKLEDGSTMSQIFTDSVNEYLINAKLYACRFDKLGLTFSAQEEENMTRALSDLSAEVGGMSALNEQLAAEGYTYEEYLTEVYDATKKTKVLEHYFGEGGEFETSDQDIKDYYNVHNALVKAIILLKYDSSTGETMVGEALNELKQKAEDAYTSASKESSTDLFPDLISMYSDDTSTLEKGMVISDNGEFAQELADAALKLEVGQVAKVETESGFFIMKRYDGTADDVFDAVTRQTALETLRADKIKAFLSQWKEEADIKINTRITKKYKPENFVQE